MKTLLRNGRIIDPANGRDEFGDLWIIDGRISEKPDRDSKSKVEEDSQTLDIGRATLDWVWSLDTHSLSV